MKAVIWRPEEKFERSNWRATKSLDAVTAGLEELGFKTSTMRQPEFPSDDADLVVTWSIYKHRFPETRCRMALLHHREKLGKDTLVLERGWLDRDFADGRYSLGFDDTGGLGRYAPLPPEGEELPRRDDGLDDLAPRELYPRAHGHVLVACQVPWDTSCQDVDFQAWLNRTCAFYLAKGEEVVVRMHPLAAGVLKPPRGVKVSTWTLEEDLEWAKLVVTWSSTVGVDALLAGRPMLAGSPRSMVYGLQEELDGAREEDRREILRRRYRAIQWRQWQPFELERGTPWMGLLQASRWKPVREMKA
jgi:hypothetical protein